MSRVINRRTKQTSSVRVIAGSLRSRKVHFHCHDQQLRPTTDRARETLFNWINPYLANAQVLDCFSGTGILAIEALSRGAKSALCLEQNSHYVNTIRDNAKHLNLPQLQCLHTNATEWLQHHSLATFAIIFVDAPFHSHLLATTITIIEQKILHPCLICIEQSAHSVPQTLDSGNVIKSKSFGTSHIQVVKIG